MRNRRITARSVRGEDGEASTVYRVEGERFSSVEAVREELEAQ